MGVALTKHNQLERLEHDGDNDNPQQIKAVKVDRMLTDTSRLSEVSILDISWPISSSSRMICNPVW
jgi:hypothetical protein